MRRNPLDAYLADNDVNQVDLAKRLGVSQSMISDWARDHRHPSLKNAFELEKATGGAILASSWIGRERKAS